MPVQFISSILDLAADQWNSLCTDNPFIQYEFFAALEQSHSTTAKTGWQPHHAVLFDGEQLIAALPLFIKSHSYGEYVFDWAWADAYRQRDLDYYPKLVTCIPFTPATGQRLLCKTHQDAQQLLTIISTAIKIEARHLGASGWHCLFTQKILHEQLSHQQCSPRLGCQFHWFNQGFTSFEQFIATFTSRKRKTLKRERRKVSEQGLELITKPAIDVTEQEWRLFYQLYHYTYLKRSGRHGYLGQDFFQRLASTMPANMVMMVALHQGEMIAAALNFRDSDTLYGRYWGCKQEFECLHFETCYYQGIEYCIKEGLQRFDPGAQGEHKIQRGFTPITTYSNHWISEPMFKNAIDDFLIREELGIQKYITDATKYLPFKET